MGISGNIRLAAPDDAGAIRGIYEPHCTGGYASFDTEAPSADEIRTRIDSTSDRYPWLVFVRDNVVAGYAYASEHMARRAYRWSCNTSVYMHEHARGIGAGKKLYESLLAILTAQGFVNAYAGITLPNAASVALHESVGFEPFVVYERVGWKFDRWLDVGWWRRSLAEAQSPPPEPLTTAQLGEEWLS